MTLASLMVDRPRTLLDLGSGPGDLGRKLVHVAQRVDAIDASLAMIERGRAMEHGDHPPCAGSTGVQKTPGSTLRTRS